MRRGNSRSESYSKRRENDNDSRYYSANENIPGVAKKGQPTELEEIEAQRKWSERDGTSSAKTMASPLQVV